MDLLLVDTSAAQRRSVVVLASLDAAAHRHMIARHAQDHAAASPEQRHSLDDDFLANVSRAAQTAASCYARDWTEAIALDVPGGVEAAYHRDWDEALATDVRLDALDHSPDAEVLRALIAESGLSEVAPPPPTGPCAPCRLAGAHHHPRGAGAGCARAGAARP